MRCLLACGLCLVLSAAAARADDPSLRVRPDPGGGVRALATVTIPAPIGVVQAILTDYAHWPDLFDVRMQVAALTITDGVATIDLRIQHALLPGERRLLCESRTTEGGKLVTELKGGDFKRYRRVWTLTPAGKGDETKADFDLTVDIDSLVPDWLVALAMRQELESHFRLVRERAGAQLKRGT